MDLGWSFLLESMDRNKVLRFAEVSHFCEEIASAERLRSEQLELKEREVLKQREEFERTLHRRNEDLRVEREMLA